MVEGNVAVMNVGESINQKLTLEAIIQIGEVEKLLKNVNLVEKQLVL